MTKEFFNKYYKDGYLTECMPISLNRIGFILEDTEYEEELNECGATLIVYLPSKIKKGDFGTVVWSDNGIGMKLSAFMTRWIVELPHFSIDEIISNTSWYPIPNNEKAHLAQGITNIDGEVYAYGMVRSVFKYKGVKKWENITTKTKHPNLYDDVEKSPTISVGSWVGFSALDGFNANDIYAGGNRGDFWHYNGEKWRRVDLPINSDISTITCSKDGKVYVCSDIGSVVIGRDNCWEVIGKAKQITHSCCFNGENYFSAKNGLIYTYNEKKKDLVEANFKTKYPSYMHRLIRGIASCEECLVIYTAVQAYAYDGEIWHEIIEIPSLSKHK